MSENNPTRSANTLPADAQAQLAIIEYRIHEHMTNAAGHLLAVGQCLNEAKAAGLVPHGEWEDWVQRNTGFSLRQAQRMMNAAREVPEGSALAQLPFSKIQACLLLPGADEREAMAKRAQEESMSLRELQQAVQDERNRADELAAINLQATAQAMRSSLEAAEAKTEADQLRKALRNAEKQARQAPAPLPTAQGISPEAQAEIDRLRAELSEAEDMIERQAGLRQQAQQELLNLKAATARGEVAAPETGLTTFELAAAVRAFVGSAGVLPHMGTTLATAASNDREQMLAYVDMVAEWVEGARRALRTVYIDENE